MTHVEKTLNGVRVRVRMELLGDFWTSRLSLVAEQGGVREQAVPTL